MYTVCPGNTYQTGLLKIVALLKQCLSIESPLIDLGFIKSIAIFASKRASLSDSVFQASQLSVESIKMVRIQRKSK